MDISSKLLQENQLKLKKQQKKLKKNKRNMKKAIEISHTKQTDVVEGYYEVESIEKIKSFGKYDLRFFIKWKGWSDNDNTWEPFQNVRSCFYNIKEFYAKSIDNKKITNSDAWKMFIGCLKRDNLIDEQGKFREVFKRKYNKRKKNEDNQSEDVGDENKSGEQENQRTRNGSDLKQINLKIEQEQDDSSKTDSKIESKRLQKQNKVLKKEAKKNKQSLNPSEENGQEVKQGNEDKDENEVVRQKRKYKKRQKLVEDDKEKDETLLKKRKFKRTYSSLTNKKQKKVKLNVEDEQIKEVNINNLNKELDQKSEEIRENHNISNQFESHSNTKINISQQEMNFSQNTLFDKRYDSQDKQIENKDEINQNQSDQFLITEQNGITNENNSQKEAQNRSIQDPENIDSNQQKEPEKQLEFYFEDDDAKKEQKLEKQLHQEEKNKQHNEIDSPFLMESVLIELQKDKQDIQEQTTENNQINPLPKKKKKKNQQVRFSSNQNINDDQLDSFQQLQMGFPDEKQSNQRANNFDDNNIHLDFINDNRIMSGILIDSCEINEVHRKKRKSDKKICKISSDEQISIQDNSQIHQFDNISLENANNDLYIEKVSNTNNLHLKSLSQNTTKNNISKVDRQQIKEHSISQDYIDKISSKKFNRYSNYPKQNQTQIISSNLNGQQYMDNTLIQKSQQYLLPYENQYNQYYNPYNYNSMQMQTLYSPVSFIPQANKQNVIQFNNQQESILNKQKLMDTQINKQVQNQINLQIDPQINTSKNKQIKDFINNQNKIQENNEFNAYLSYKSNHKIKNFIASKANSYESCKNNYQINEQINNQINKKINGSYNNTLYNKLNTQLQNIIKKDQQTNIYQQSNKIHETIDIDDDHDQNADKDDVIENHELNFKLYSEKDDKDKCTKIRLIKKIDSVEIQDSKPYNSPLQYLDELQKKKLKFSNYNDVQGQSGGLSKNLNDLNNLSQPELKNQYNKYKKDIQQLQNNNTNGSQKQTQLSNGPNIIPQFNDQTYEQFIFSQFQEVKHLKNPNITDPQKNIKSLYEGNLALKDEPTRIIAIDIHPYLVDQYIFKVCWLPRKKRDQLLTSWVEGDKLKQKYPNIVFEFYESYIRFID